MKIKTILLENIYIPYLSHILSSDYILNNEYMFIMLKDVKKLPPISVIKLSDSEYSLSDGYHRLSIFKHLNYKKIICEILN